MTGNQQLTPYFGVLMFASLVACVLSLVLLKRGITVNPIAYFIGVFVVQILGTYPLLNPIEEADFLHAHIIVLASLVILGFSFLLGRSTETARRIEHWKEMPDLPLARALRKRNKSARRRSKQNPFVGFLGSELSRVVFLLAISIAASIFYYHIVGYNLFVETLRSPADIEDFTTMRLASYAGENYTGAGIFNQFKNTILPVSFFAILIHLLSRAHWCWVAAFLIAVGPVFLYCILGTGQRAFLFYSLMMFVIATINQKRGRNVVLLACFISAFLILFGMYSMLLGRQAEEDGGLIGVLGQLYYRIFMAQQQASVMGFRYLYPLEITYGYEWFEALRGLIPGVRGSTLSNRVHAYMYVSDRGTAPVSFWVSSYHNFGVMGIVLAGLAWLMLLRKTFHFLISLRKTAINRMVVSALLLYCGLTVVANPTQIFNYGLFGIIFIFVCVGVSRSLSPQRYAAGLYRLRRKRSVRKSV